MMKAAHDRLSFRYFSRNSFSEGSSMAYRILAFFVLILACPTEPLQALFYLACRRLDSLKVYQRVRD